MAPVAKREANGTPTASPSQVYLDSRNLTLEIRGGRSGTSGHWVPVGFWRFLFSSFSFVRQKYDYMNDHQEKFESRSRTRYRTSTSPIWAFSFGKGQLFAFFGYENRTPAGCSAGVMMDDLVDIRQGLSSPDFQQLGHLRAEQVAMLTSWTNTKVPSGKLT